ncbi:HD domain-containing protein [Mesoterricola silvestris]|uniref:HD domain-containing protein n=1 Tax=Mesoterricola silvestris TaxID=2927979 RepID=A0AA48GYZ0_9BACT|nr:HD domain-containing protein [Mesoterricola silvestris]BDU72943.1 hypothetical protein METEAL_21170 [Mesoterricola silvestris]
MKIMTAQTAMGLQEVKRWHTRRVDREQTVASHTASLIGIALILAKPYNLNPNDRCDLVELALIHDAHETEYGDIPYPTRMKFLELGFDLDLIARKAFWGGIDPYDMVMPHVAVLVDVADAVEAAMWSQDNAPKVAPSAVARALELSQALNNEVQALVLEMLGIRPEVDQ